MAVNQSRYEKKLPISSKTRVSGLSVGEEMTDILCSDYATRLVKGVIFLLELFIVLYSLQSRGECVGSSSS